MRVKLIQQAGITKLNLCFLVVTVLLFLEDLSAPKPFVTVKKEGHYKINFTRYRYRNTTPAFKSSLTRRNIEFKRFGGKELLSPT